MSEAEAAERPEPRRWSPVEPGAGGVREPAVIEREVVALGYAEAVAELEEILGELERDDVDVDVLAPKVKRAAALIRHCRAHIGAAKLDVEQIVADLDDLDGLDGDER